MSLNAVDTGGPGVTSEGGLTAVPRFMRHKRGDHAVAVRTLYVHVSAQFRDLRMMGCHADILL